LALLYYEIGDLTSVLAAFLAGGLIGLVIAVKVKMIHMPQAVAFLNGVGATASALIALATIFNGDATTFFVQLTSVLALIIGSLAMSGSLIAVGKLSGVFSPKPVVLKGHSTFFFATIFILILLWGLSPFLPLSMAFVLLTLGLAICFGFLFAIRIGGADMPIMISLLNAGFFVSQDALIPLFSPAIRKGSCSPALYNYTVLGGQEPQIQIECFRMKFNRFNPLFFEKSSYKNQSVSDLPVIILFSNPLVTCTF